MHGVLEGVTKSLMTYWFDSHYSRNSFSLVKYLGQIDRKLISVKPPHEIRRSPRSIASTRKFLKASRVSGMASFLFLANSWALSSSISSQDLEIADNLLVCFYQHMTDLYGDNSCLINVHNLIHLVLLVKQWGPLWVYSCFGFENMNGHIKKMFHGTCQILDQLVFSFKAQQSLFFKSKLLDSENHVTMEFVRQYTTQHSIVSSDGIAFFGRQKGGPLVSSHYSVLTQYLSQRHQTANIFETAEQIKKGHVYYHT